MGQLIVFYVPASFRSSSANWFRRQNVESSSSSRRKSKNRLRLLTGRRRASAFGQHVRSLFASSGS